MTLTSSGPSFTIRRAMPADAQAIAEVHTQSWRETYTGLLEPDFLAQATNAEALQRRRDSWAKVLETGQGHVFVAQQGAAVVAFASVDIARDHPHYTHELMTLYSLQTAQGLGIGKALMARVMRQVRQSGGQNLALWVLANNPTRQWYAAQGAREAGEKSEDGLREVRMVWDKLPL